jgi:formylglycine-generating enzyme required for sulfatase activity
MAPDPERPRFLAELKWEGSALKAIRGDAPRTGPPYDERYADLARERMEREGRAVRLALAVTLMVVLLTTWWVIRGTSTETHLSRTAQGRPRTHSAMLDIPAGQFWMGAARSDSAAQEDEVPGHWVFLRTFRIDATEVTNADYDLFVSAVRDTGHSRHHPYEPPKKNHERWRYAGLSGPSQPVVGVDWWDAYAYCASSGKRLPSEAEWEKAARGTDGRIYPWGDEWGISRAETTSSHLRDASPYGVRDTAGSVYEWVRDWYASDYYSRAPDRNPQGPGSGRWRVIRGGAQGLNPELLRSSTRFFSDPAERVEYVGFRCVRDS